MLVLVVLGVGVAEQQMFARGFAVSNFEFYHVLGKCDEHSLSCRVLHSC